jgi:hypothetical protein
MKIIKQVAVDWKETFTTDKKLFWAELSGTILGMFASATLSIFASNPPMLTVFIAYTISSILMIYAMHKRKSISPMILMIFYTIINIIGICRL